MDKNLHKYLRAVGFSKYKTRKQIQDLIVKAVKSAHEKAYTTVEEDTLYAEYKADFGGGLSLCVRGEYDENNKFLYDYYFPFFDATGYTSSDDISVERHKDKLSFAGILDDLKSGISLIFYLQNIITYIKLLNMDRLPVRGTNVTLSALSDGGKILMPIRKNETEIRKAQNYSIRKSRMIAAARNGDEDALENLTMSDMDTYSALQKKIPEEDILSLVDSYFMPYGVECDIYSIMGEILDYEMLHNSLTGEEVCVMTVYANEIAVDVCINREDLLGEPEIGRRFKGIIWLQGRINFPENV